MSQIEVIGLSKLNAKLGRIQNNVTPGLIKTTKKATLLVHSNLPGYPPPPAGSTYRRTGLLGRTITTDVKSLGNEVVGVIGTITKYAPWVISKKRVGNRGPQSRAHKVRWWTLQEEVARHRKAIVGMYRKFIRGLIS